ncbi:DUF2589 domain-containing protein [Pseudomonas oryzihabitans]|uniref:DUF2589 domain-containing protein n=1 Tax=Pseudomonas oryzihabitans TaxID=47885 RepID=UPI0028594664|nr:DUF2589 domain-containing protein [Pseudomonas psychrotolerans]MDR6679862.1 hypothetical protein [Pseudomonas psychrotolerans]
MANLSLHLLIQSIAGAVAEAQDKIQRFQVSTVSKYFDEDNRPVSVDVRLPSNSPNASEGDERIVRVPLLSLVGARLLAVKDMEISFEVGLNGQEDEVDATPPSSPEDDALSSWPDETHKALGVDLGARRNGEGGPLARVTLRVETQPPCEGMARLIQNLDKLI